ncbi:hypothetical protein QBC39DRAFT_354030 [Podospora conica]|nr:hypothetical protein QBC39DRAFT_354030 [Schizothecium conicum]
MEAVGAGASVLAFVLLALKSAKAAYEVLSAVKDGNTHVAQATHSIERLQSTLELLERRGEQHDQFLLKTTKTCADEMKAFAEQLGKLAKPQTGVRRQLTKAMIFLKEDDLKRMSAAVVGHTTALNFYLGIQQGETIRAVRDDVRAVLPVQQSIRETQTTILTEQTTLTTLIRDSMSQSTNQSHSIHETIQTSMQNLATREDVQGINHLLQQLLSHLHPSPEITAQPRVVEIANDGTEEASSEPDLEDELEASIFFIVEALQDRCGILADNKAREVCDALLDFLDKAVSSGQLLTSKMAAGVDNDDDDLRTLRDNLRVVKGAILNSRQVSVNERSRKLLFDDREIVISRNTTYKTLSIRSGTISLHSTESHSKIVGNYRVPGLSKWDHDMSGEADAYGCTTDTRIGFTPRIQGRTTKGQGFEVILRSSHGYHGSYQAIPKLFANNIIPNNSLVFRVVENGDLGTFQRMLTNGEASIRDQNERGAPLLFYACRQPDMCRFLLEHGADVGCVARVPGRERDTGNALSVYEDVDQWGGGDSSARERFGACVELLLNAGCDPGVRSSWPPSFLELALRFCNPTIFRMLYTSGFIQAYTSVNIGFHNATLLHLYAGGCYPTAKGFSLILQQGVDIHARCSKGFTCLHYLFDNIDNIRGSASGPEGQSDHGIRLGLLDACDTLVRGGADVDAAENMGRSVSQMAYADSRRGLNSFPGDLWDRVLAGNGLDVVAFRNRSGIPRRAHYGYGYERRDFEALWAGMTHLCPYFNDYEPPPYHKLYSQRALLGFRSLWHQWGDEIEVGAIRRRNLLDFDNIDGEDNEIEVWEGDGSDLALSFDAAWNAVGTGVETGTVNGFATGILMEIKTVALAGMKTGTAIGQTTRRGKRTTMGATKRIAMTGDAGSSNLRVGYIACISLRTVTPKNHSITCPQGHLSQRKNRYLPPRHLDSKQQRTGRAGGGG